VAGQPRVIEGIPVVVFIGRTRPLREAPAAEVFEVAAATEVEEVTEVAEAIGADRQKILSI